MGSSRQKYWSGQPFSSPGNLPSSGIEHGSPEWQADSLVLHEIDVHLKSCHKAVFINKPWSRTYYVQDLGVLLAIWRWVRCISCPHEFGLPEKRGCGMCFCGIYVYRDTGRRRIKQLFVPGRIRKDKESCQVYSITKDWVGGLHQALFNGKGIPPREEHVPVQWHMSSCWVWVYNWYY